MADQKISELPVLAGANLADDDGFVVLDNSTTITKRISSTEVRSGIGLTQAQAEDSASTVFGTVSGERLAQAVAENESVSEVSYATMKRPSVSYGTASVENGNVATFISETSLDDFGLMRLDISASATFNGRAFLYMRMSSDNGANWSSWVKINNVAVNAAVFLGGYINLVSGDVSLVGIEYVSDDRVNKNVLSGGNANAVEIRVESEINAEANANGIMVPYSGRAV